jgi:hypothetical protein
LRTRQQHDGHAAQQIWKASRGNAVLTKSGTIGKNDKLWKNYWTQNKFMLSFHKGVCCRIGFEAKFSDFARAK